jgi:outer membrane receptor for ferrienterochelin and colicins
MRSRTVGFTFLLFVAAMVWLPQPGVAQQGTIAGRVVDSDTNQPVQAAQVSVLGAGRGQGTLTDAQGAFSLSLAPGSYSLAIQFIGYQEARVDGIAVTRGGTTSMTVSLVPMALALDPFSVTVSRGRSERTSAAPAAVNVTTPEIIEETATTTPVDYVKGMPGVDVIQTGLNQSNTVTRGFNNVFSGALLVLTDNRYARVPSLRLNAYNMIPATPLDIERVEVVLGPAAALYGPNSASGVMHIITTSPIDKPGSSFSLTAGGRSIFQGVFRQAWNFNDKSGLKISGQYFRGNDFVYTDPVEVAAMNPSNPKIGARDFNSERFGGEIRYDLRPWDNPDDGIIATYGLNQVVSSIELTGIGAGQAKDWKYQFGQVRLNKGRLFAQAFLNKSNSGDTFLLRTGAPTIDQSKMFAAQVQYGFLLGDRIDLITGIDYSKTTPQTEGTITGSNENNDNTTEVGGYLQSTITLSDKLDLVGAIRVDKHEHLEDPVYSPRAALVVKPIPGHTFRATYNRAFSTPTTNNLFLDLTAANIPITPGVGYRVQTFGVPSTGFTWNESCAGGVQNFCMYSPFAPGQKMPATGAALWDAVLVPLALQDPTLTATLPLLGLTPESFAAIVGNPQPGELNSVLLRFNSENPSVPFVPDPGVSPLGRMRPTITTTYEAGYQGLIANRFKFSANVYSSKVRDFVGPLRVETPSVFLDGASVANYLVSRLSAVGIPVAVATQIAQGIAPTAATVPLGTVAPDQRPSSDLLLTYRNFGDVDFWGADFGMEFFLTDRLSVNGSYSYVSEECFDFNNDNSCSSSSDVALNAPTNKGSGGFRYDNKVSGISLAARIRYSDSFAMNSGVYVGTVDSYTVLDLNAAYRVPGYRGFIVSVTVNNFTDNLHQEFIGAPEMGRIGLLKVQYAF